MRCGTGACNAAVISLDSDRAKRLKTADCQIAGERLDSNRATRTVAVGIELQVLDGSSVSQRKQNISACAWRRRRKVTTTGGNNAGAKRIMRASFDLSPACYRHIPAIAASVPVTTANIDAVDGNVSGGGGRDRNITTLTTCARLGVANAALGGNSTATAERCTIVAVRDVDVNLTALAAGTACATISSHNLASFAHNTVTQQRDCSAHSTYSDIAGCIAT